MIHPAVVRRQGEIIGIINNKRGEFPPINELIHASASNLTANPPDLLLQLTDVRHTGFSSHAGASKTVRMLDHQRISQTLGQRISLPDIWHVDP